MVYGASDPSDVGRRSVGIPLTRAPRSLSPRAGRGLGSSGGTSTQRRSRQLCKPIRRAARLSPLRAGSSGTDSPVTTCVRNSSHSTLNALSYARFVGHVLPRREEVDGLRNVGVPHGLRRGGARLDLAVGEPGDRGAERAVDMERDEIVAAHARAPRAVDLRDDRRHRARTSRRRRRRRWHRTACPTSSQRFAMCVAPRQLTALTSPKRLSST